MELIKNTIRDIAYFILVLMTFVFSFASGIYLLAVNRIALPLYDKEPIYPYEDYNGSLLGEGFFN